MQLDPETRDQGPPANHPKAYQPPQLEILPLDCEITAYAPDGDDPLF